MKGLFQTIIVSGLLYVVPPIPEFNYIKPDLLKKIENESKINKLNDCYVKAVFLTESAFNAQAVSVAGAKGIAQLMPDNIKKLKVKNPHDPFESIEAGTYYLKIGDKEYANGDLKKLSKLSLIHI